MRRFLTIGALVLLGACAKDATGPAGPQGPTGATGPQGPAGPAGASGATRLTFYGTADGSGTGFADLPAAAGTMTNPPIFACYLEYMLSGVPFWEEAGTSETTGAAPNALCVLGLKPGATTLRVGVGGAQSGQAIAIVVIY